MSRFFGLDRPPFRRRVHTVWLVSDVGEGWRSPVRAFATREEALECARAREERLGADPMWRDYIGSRVDEASLTVGRRFDWQ